MPEARDYLASPMALDQGKAIGAIVPPSNLGGYVAGFEIARLFLLAVISVGAVFAFEMFV